MNITLTNMVMIQDKNTGKVLVQNRIKNYKGLSFPGGHIENNESFYDSAVREVKEETGLDISNLSYCGVIHWLNRVTHEKYLVFLYKTSNYSGSLITEVEEGTNMWMTVEELQNTPSENGLLDYLPMFFNKYNEAYAPYIDGEPITVTFK